MGKQHRDDTKQVDGASKKKSSTKEKRKNTIKKPKKKRSVGVVHKKISAGINISPQIVFRGEDLQDLLKGARVVWKDIDCVLSGLPEGITLVDLKVDT